ncbi:putative glycosyltransferase [Rhodoligotrophos appendicifer]|uniref:glycosyltransferase family protein n=1 Tax=Rhodoligotrophos appendicifer TaxID=987056 RepID=UPI001184D5E8|nr:glycosyltransferase [Rhodoligotrophos appendicifer]
MKTDNPRVLIWVTHVLGIGHFRRISALAEALVEAGLEPLITSGGMPVPGGATPGVRLEQLPPVKSADDGYTNLVDESGEVASEGLFLRRTDKLLALFRTFDPGMIVTELYPFGRRLFAQEVDALLMKAAEAARRPKIICSVRDILQPPSRPEKIAGMRRRIETFYDAILVHGDADFVKVEESLPLMSEFADLIRYTGYISQAPGPDGDGGAGKNEIIVSAGGGAVGRDLLLAAAAAREISAARGHTWRFLVGHNMIAEEANRVRDLAGPGVIVEAARSDFATLLKRARLSISQAGYNTCTDVFNTMVSSVFVPFAGAGEIEQPLRARILEEKGFGISVSASDLSPRRLAAAIDKAMMLDAGSALRPRLDGAAQAARFMADMLEKARP